MSINIPEIRHLFTVVQTAELLLAGRRPNPSPEKIAFAEGESDFFGQFFTLHIIKKLKLVHNLI